MLAQRLKVVNHLIQVLFEQFSIQHETIAHIRENYIIILPVNILTVWLLRATQQGSVS